jgi:hypothetical protein
MHPIPRRLQRAATYITAHLISQVHREEVHDNLQYRLTSLGLPPVHTSCPHCCWLERFSIPRFRIEIHDPHGCVRRKPHIPGRRPVVTHTHTHHTCNSHPHTHHPWTLSQRVWIGNYKATAVLEGARSQMPSICIPLLSDPILLLIIQPQSLTTITTLNLIISYPSPYPPLPSYTKQHPIQSHPIPPSKNIHPPLRPGGHTDRQTNAPF